MRVISCVKEQMHEMERQQRKMRSSSHIRTRHDPRSGMGKNYTRGFYSSKACGKGWEKGGHNGDLTQSPLVINDTI